MNATRSRNAFTLVEVMIVVTIIGIIAAIAIPAFDQIRRRSRISTFTNDLRIYDQAFTNYEAEHATFPPSEPTDGVIPQEMEGLLSSQWVSSRPVNGVYSWVYNPNPDPAQSEAFVRVRATAANPLMLDDADLRQVDENIDDGNIGTGRLVKQGNGLRFYIKRSGG
jgi:prepilin-type N-terminal cleavage/methylation domain-containing protein